MGALARLLDRQRRGPSADAPQAGPVPAPPAGRRSSDLLHAAGLTTEQLRVTWLAASWLLTYPGPSTLERFAQVSGLIAGLPEQPRSLLQDTITRVLAMDDGEAEQHYVDTFDTRRRGCLYLTYFGQGDTRRRGIALVRIKQDFRAGGVEVGDTELPDHLPLVLEFAAAHDPERGAKILRQNRPGVELLRLHLRDIDSPWHGAVAAVCATMPPLDADDRGAVMRLAAEGPPDEQVGLEGYGAEGFGPGGVAGAAGTGAPGPFDIDPDTAEGAAALLMMRSGETCGSHQPPSGPQPVHIMRGRPS